VDTSERSTVEAYLSLVREFFAEVTNFRREQNRLGREMPDPLFSDFLCARGYIALSNRVRRAELELQDLLGLFSYECSVMFGWGTIRLTFR
jgi:hypothetical protein